MVPPFPCCPVSFQCLWKKTLIDKKNTVPQTWVLNGKETGTIKWNCTPLFNLESLLAILFNHTGP